jgi:hypothetical protein
MTVKKPPMDPRTLELLRIAATALAEIPYAIGGAIALQGHGVRRFTTDVDVFVLSANRGRALKALRQAGLEVVPIMEPFHYAAYLGSHDDPEIRIDVLVPAGEPELTAIENPVLLHVGDVSFHGFSAELLAATKLYSDRLKDHGDIESLVQRGIVDPRLVYALIESFDPDGAKDWEELVRRIERPRGRPRPKRRGT